MMSTPAVLKPIIHLYQLFSQPGVLGEDGAEYVRVKNLALEIIGAPQAKELILFLRADAAEALALCRLTLDGQPIVDFVSDSIEDWFEWELIDTLYVRDQLNEACHLIFLEYHERVKQYALDHYWRKGGEPILDCLNILEELDICNNHAPFALEISLEKDVLTANFLHRHGVVAPEDVSTLIWYDPESLHKGLDSFHQFLRRMNRAAERPILLLFFIPIEPYSGDYFKILSLHDLTTTIPQMQKITADIVATYEEMRQRHKSEYRSAEGRLDLPPSLLLSKKHHIAGYPTHPLFTEGPLRSWLLYLLSAWLAEGTNLESNTANFTFGANQKASLEFHWHDVQIGGTSVFSDSWQTLAPLLANDIQTYAGSNSLRGLWAKAASAMLTKVGDPSAETFLDTIAAIHDEFLQLKNKPVDLGDTQPDLVLTISLVHKSEGSYLDFSLHSQPHLEIFQKDAGSIRLSHAAGTKHFDDLNEAARYYRTRILKPDEPILHPAPPTVERLEENGGELWRSFIPQSLKRLYARLKEEKNLTAFIISDDPSFPWELVKPYESKGSEIDSTGFVHLWWALQFTLARWLAGHRHPATKIELNRICCVATTSKTPKSKEEAEFFRRSGVHVDLPNTKEELIEMLEIHDYGILHFACHGNFSEEREEESVVLLPDNTHLTPRNFIHKPEIEEKFNQNRPLVFLNSCHSGRTGSGLTDIQGWAKRFLDMGCGAFIGCGWEVSDPLAAQFATTFYQFFMNDNTLGQAVRQARLALQDEHPANSTWLAYYLYGNPYCKLIR